MREASSISDIWKEVSRGATLPYVLKIKITDNVTKRPGFLYLFDLFHPRFLPLTPEVEKNQHIYYSFEKLSKYIW
jgi:hypothetical protein